MNRNQSLFLLSRQFNVISIISKQETFSFNDAEYTMGSGLVEVDRDSERPVTIRLLTR